LVKVKICGLTNIEDALKACEYGADLLGFVFAEGSPRSVGPETVKDILEAIPKGVGKAGLFKDDTLEEVEKCVLSCGLDHIQLHGDESPAYCAELKETMRKEAKSISIIKTFKVKDKILGLPVEAYVEADYYLFDTFHENMMGGTGIKFDWSVVRDFKGDRPFFLAGGLNPLNVAEAVREVNPYGVDVSSGVEESAGKKDENKLKEFIQNAKNA